MIEIGVQPGIRAVARSAGRRESAGGVIRITGRLEVRSVTGVALRRHRLVLTGGRSLVASVAIHCRMGAR